MIWCDAEYNDDVVICFGFIKDGKEYWYTKASDIEKFIEKHKDEVFSAYYIGAEIQALLRLGIGGAAGLKWIDLQTECRMFTMSMSKYLTGDATLLGQIRSLLVRDVKEDKEHKDEMRDLILSKNTFTKSELEKIREYNLSDIRPLPELWEKIIKLHRLHKTGQQSKHMLQRGYYSKISAVMDFYSEGFPVAGDAFHKVFQNRARIKELIVEELPPIWRMCYEKRKGKDGYTLKRNLVAEVIKHNGWNKWETTDNGKPKLEADYLEEIERYYPEVQSLRRAQQSLTTLNSRDLREIERDGWVKPSTFAFAAKTGRNGLKPKQGFLLNLPNWQRAIIRPHKGRVIIGVDFSQQEIAVAASLSEDERLIEAYQSGDVYLALGQAAGVIPADGTKHTHKRQRDEFKALQLALAYGKGFRSLGVDLWALSRDEGKTLDECVMRASELYDWHKKHFSKYWMWIEDQVRKAKMRGWIASEDKWLEFVDYRTPKTVLLNFPSQSNGATLLRRTTFRLYDEWLEGRLPPMLCSQHDAVYYNSNESECDYHSRIIQRVMREVSTEMLGFECRSDVKVYTHEEGYKPDGFAYKGEALWRKVMEL